MGYGSDNRPVPHTHRVAQGTRHQGRVSQKLVLDGGYRKGYFVADLGKGELKKFPDKNFPKNPKIFPKNPKFFRIKPYIFLEKSPKTPKNPGFYRKTPKYFRKIL